MQHFSSKLRIRSSTHHGKCSVCVRHRLIIKRVGQGPARTSQLLLYQQHLRRQYRDRQQYWHCRAVSRLQASSGEPVTEVSLILDSMDQAKHCYPRSECMGSKEFQQFYRPKMMNTSIIIHGHAVLVGLSPSNVPGNSSRAAELLAYSMTKSVELGINWSMCFLHVEADNCAKEIKNQCVLRLVASLTCQHKLAGCQLSFLSSGHSHEDIDAMFSQIASHLTSHRELWTVDDFRQCIQKFFSDPMVRKHEPFREVFLFDQFRDWKLGNFASSWLRIGQSERLVRKNHFHTLLDKAHVKGIGGPGAPHVFRLERIRDTGPLLILEKHHCESEDFVMSRSSTSSGGGADCRDTAPMSC